MKQADLKRDYVYNPETGDFIGRSGKVVGSVDQGGYIVLSLNKKLIKAHRAAMVYMGFDIPDGYVVDHINGERTDNRLCNLRLATKAQNSYNRVKNKNNSSGAKGVYFIQNLGKWAASFQFKGKKIYLGVYSTVEDAAEAVRVNRGLYHGEFTNHGNGNAVV
jgi:hypothetical protein